ncbi:DUF1801 domain-containing protein [Niabella insulamsoli]|uniref:DUF1801 domain-containing protein n=1 Tax=Niabella insulamsoli TaxID=3144874 RepID=UPI0031FDA6C5
MDTAIGQYNQAQTETDRLICEALAEEITAGLPAATSKIWHAHPVWFLEGNPVAGYSKMKEGIRLMFWSGADFGEADLKPGSGKFKDASVTYTAAEQINKADLKRWLKKAQDIQWDYKNIVKRKGKLERLK